MKLLIIFVVVSFGHFSVYANTCLDYLNLAKTNQESFYFPNSTYHRLNYINNESDAVETDAIDTSVNNVLSYLNRVTTSLGRSVGGVKSVFYPASGSDAITAFRSFEGAETVIGLDSNPFAPNDLEDVRLLPTFKERTQYDVWGDVTVSGRIPITDRSYRVVRSSIAEIVLKDLKTHYPNLVVHEISRIDTKPYDSDDEGNVATNGIIKFSIEPGAPIRQYIHIHLPLIGGGASHKNMPEFMFLVDLVLNYGFQGLIAKAAMGNIFFRPTTEEDLKRRQENYPSSPSFYDRSKLDEPESPGFRAVRHLSENGGIFIDGDGAGFSSSEFINSDFVSFTIKPSRAGNEWIYTGKGGVSGKEYGYYKYKFGYAGEKIEIHFYTPTPRNN